MLAVACLLLMCEIVCCVLSFVAAGVRRCFVVRPCSLSFDVACCYALCVVCNFVLVVVNCLMCWCVLCVVCCIGVCCSLIDVCCLLFCVD